MANFNFKPVDDAKLATLAEARSWAGEHQYQVTEVKTDDLIMNEDGTIRVLNSSKNVLEFTQDGFKRFCGTLKFPIDFIVRLGNELTATNVNRLLAGHDQKTLFFVTRVSDGAIVNVCQTEPQTAVTNLSVLNSFQENGFRVKRVRMGDRGMNLQVSSSALSTEPVKGDIFELGLNVDNSETGFGRTQGQLYLYRLVCENGAVAPIAFGNVAKARGSKLSTQEVVKDFMKRLQNLKANAEVVKEGLAKMYQMPLTEADLTVLWKKTKAILGSEVEADGAIGVQQDYRKEVNLRDSARKLEVKRMLSDELVISPSSRLKASEVFNNITYTAHNHRLVQAAQLESVAGNILGLAFGKSLVKN